MYVGERVKRKEDLKFITGSGRYVDDIEYPGTLYLYIVRSNIAHAKIKKIDVSDALKVNGVVGVITGLTIPFENRPRNWPMAKDEILYVGHPIAAILATDKYTAADAADWVQIDYEELPAVIDAEKALKDDVKAVESKVILLIRRFITRVTQIKHFQTQILYWRRNSKFQGFIPRQWKLEDCFQYIKRVVC